MSEDSVAKQSVEKEIESSSGKMPESSISNVLNGELSFDKNTRNIYHVESSKNEALSKEIDPKEYDKNVHESGDGKVSESEIINVLTGDVSCDKYVGGFYNGESSKLYYTDHKEYPSSAMTQLIEASEYAGFDFYNTKNDSLSNMVKTGKEEIHLDGLEIVDDPFVQTHMKQNSEVNVVNENKPPLFGKVVGQLLRKRFVENAQVEPHTVQSPTTAPSVFVKVDRKRRKRKVMMLEKNIRFSFDDDDDVADDEPDLCVISLEEWNLSRAPYSRRTKVKLPEYIDTVYALGDETSHRFPWGNNDIGVYRSFWLNLLGLNDGEIYLYGSVMELGISLIGQTWNRFAFL
nr:hypothetical protein [Tanacetum cinerariifolium]